VDATKRRYKVIVDMMHAAGVANAFMKR